jgi:gamma-glutamylaminecyclotransferase
MPSLVFVYGTLKEGFPNFHINRGRRLAGRFITVRPYPMYIVGSIQVPWLVDRPGSGHQVIGEVYEVDDNTLAALDELEQVDEDGWYSRRLIQVGRHPDGADPMEVYVYFGDPARIDPAAGNPDPTDRAGPFAEYTLEQSRSYRDGNSGAGETK